MPPIPEKSALVKLNKINRFEDYNKEILDNRKRGLVIFLQKLVNHLELRYTPELIAFVTESNQKFETTKTTSAQRR